MDEKSHYPSKHDLENGLCTAPDGSEAPMVVSELPEPVRTGRLPERTGSRRRDGDMCPMGQEALEFAPKREKGLPSVPSEEGERKIAGMRRRSFIVVVVLAALVIIGAVVGGAVGGTRNRKNGTSSSSSNEVLDPSSTSSPPENDNATTQPQTQTPTPSTPATPTMTFKLQVWESSSYLGRSQLIYTPGGYQPAFLIKSYHWAPGAYESKIKCSVATCLNGGENGWWGSSERYWPGDFQNTSRGLLFVNIECGPAFESPACPGPADQTTYSSVPVLETTSLDPSRTIVDGEVVTPTSSSTTGSGSRSGTGALTTGGRAQSTLGSSTLTPTPTPTGK